MNCIYCYEDKSSKETFDIEIAKERISKFLDKPTEKGTLIDLHGGEPFMVFDKIKELCEWLWCQNSKEKFLVYCTTNGTLVHGEIKKWLNANKHRFCCGLSFDGNRNMQNANRSNSFDKIDLDFFLNTWPSQGIKMTISPKSINELADGVIFLHRKGVKEIHANLAEMVYWPKELKSVYRRELEKLADYYLKHQDVDPCTLFKVPFFKIGKAGNVDKWCGVGTMNAYDIIGDKKYPCHLFFESVCGKDKSEQCFSIDFNDPHVYVSTECNNCPFLAICPTCYGSNYIARGDIGKRDMDICEFQKIRFSVVANFEYQKIMHSLSHIDDFEEEEKRKMLLKIEGIMKITTELNKIELDE